MALKQYLEEFKQNKIGFAILGLGVLAALLVGMLAYKTLTDTSSGHQGPEISQEEINAFKQSGAPQEQAAVRQETRQSYKRQKSISENQIVGAWDTRINGARVLLQLQKGTYRIIVIYDNPAAARWYSNGTYEMRDDLLILTPNLDWGPPKNSRFGYRVLTRGTMPVAVSKHKGRLIWQVPGPDADIYVPNYHPILSETKDKIAVWRVLK